MRTGTREMTPASIPLSFRDLIKRRVQRRIGFAGEQLRLSFQAENRSRQLHRKPPFRAVSATPPYAFARTERSEEHTSELQSLMRISYAVFCLKKKTTNKYATRKQYTTKKKKL